MNRVLQPAPCPWLGPLLATEILPLGTPTAPKPEGGKRFITKAERHTKLKSPGLVSVRAAPTAGNAQWGVAFYLDRL